MRALPRRVTIARRNLELCFKALPAKEREKLLIKNFESVGMGVLETGIAGSGQTGVYANGLRLRVMNIWKVCELKIKACFSSVCTF